MHGVVDGTFVLAREHPMKSIPCACNEASGFFFLCIL